jgi:hypothetical protein
MTKKQWEKIRITMPMNVGSSGISMPKGYSLAKITSGITTKTIEYHKRAKTYKRKR